VEAGSDITIPAYVVDICKRLHEAGFKCYVVGGALRDQFLPGRPEPREWDLATSARPDDVRRLFPRTVPTGIAHGTVTVLDGEGACEVTTFRQEGSYSDARHPDSVEFRDSIEEDLARRDFTVNAMALDPVRGVLVDPHGGMDDLRDRLIRAVGNPAARFREDGLRPLRAARFVAVLGFRMESDTFQAMDAALKSFLMVSAERKRDEIIKMMGAEKPSLGWEVLRKARYLKAVFPEMQKMPGVMQGGLHRYDVWNHSIMTCDFCGGGWPVRLAALLHDVGKPFTAAEEKPEAGAEGSAEGKGGDGPRMTFYRHEEVGAEIVERWMERMKFSNDDARRVVRLIRHHMVLYSPEWTDAAVRRFIRRVGEDLLDDVMSLAEADVKARGVIEDSLSRLKELQTRVRQELKKEVALSLKDLAVSGIDIMKALAMDPGPDVGRILRDLLEAVIENPSLNKRETLLEMAGEMRRAPRGTDA
jgi:tRNA nucleotidyltransferase (CCA-adding enzyme)